MALTRPFPIDKAFPNAADLRKGQSAIYPREGVFPDPITVAPAGIAYANGGWNVAARAFTANLKRGGAPYSQNYGAAQIANDAVVGAAWVLPGAPSSGSITSLLWVRATDPTQGEATTQVSGEVDAAGNPRPRAVPVFGITTGTTTVAPTLPSGAELIATATISSTSTSAATSTIVQAYDFANVVGSPIYVRTAALLTAATAAAGVTGETAFALDTLATYEIRQNTATPPVRRWVRRGGGQFVGTRAQLIGNGSVSNLGGFTRDASNSDRDDFFTPGSLNLAEGDYIVTLTMPLPAASTGRSFIEIGGGGASARGPMPTGEDKVTLTAPFRAPEGGAQVALRAFLNVSAGSATPNFLLQIVKVS